MYKFCSPKATVLLLGFAFLWTAVPSWGAESLKIGIIDIQKCIQQSESGQKASKGLQEKVDQIKKDLEARREELKNMSDELNQKSSVLSAEAKREQEKELILKNEDLKELARKKEEEIQREEYIAMQPLLNDLFEITKKLAKEEGFSMILESKAGLVYSNEPVEDITDKIIRLANEAKKEDIKK